MDDDDSGEERPLYIKEEDDDEKEEKPKGNDDEDGDEDDDDSGNDTRLSQLHNTTVEKTEDSDEDMPLVKYYNLIIQKWFSLQSTLSFEFHLKTFSFRKLAIFPSFFLIVKY